MIENSPWTYHYDNCDEYGNGEIHDSCGGFVAITTGPNYGAWHKDGHSHFEGIARLIASAPDLLESLIGCMEALASHVPDCIEVECARAAIAKATGR